MFPFRYFSFRRLFTLLLVTGSIFVEGIALRPPQKAQAQQPFSLPFTTPPGPATWLIGQQYGNTTGAYNTGQYEYMYGQGLHFGVDFLAPCRTPIVALADGVIDQVDNFQHGAAPHNLMIRYDSLGFISLYGHLYRKPTVTVGQVVKRGEVVAESGDPEGTCVSRPHLHLEIRSLDYATAYNPITLIDADWAMLSTIGSNGFPMFAKDLYAPNRWQSIDQQPDVIFGGDILNRFRATWPPMARVSPSPATQGPLDAAPTPENGTPIFRQLTAPECCSQPWWSPDGESLNYWDGPEGQFASVMSVGVNGDSTPQVVPNAPSRLLSPDGIYEVQWSTKSVAIVRLSDNKSFPISTNGVWPQFSPDSTHLLWLVEPKDDIPGSAPPIAQIFVSNVDGTDKKVIQYQSGGSAMWLDNDRVLFVTREGRTNVSAVSMYSLSTGETSPLMTQTNLMGLSVAPGGKYIMYSLVFQQDASQDGIQLMETQTDAQPIKVPFFGDWRWRDSHSVIFIPYTPGKPMSFQLFNLDTGKITALTDPASQTFTISSDDWSISPDGEHIVFWGNTSPGDRDYSLWLVTLAT